MNYPLWDVPLLGGGLVIALIAVPHVFVSHFAIGGGIFLAWTERLARRTNNAQLLEFVKKKTFFFVLITLVFGAVSGVGIWFSIALVHPSATSMLIHNFVFAWAIEWVFFLIEIAAVLVYYYSWDRVDGRTHLLIGWVYAGAAWMSLFVINGILAFMLTPGAWLENGSFWSAFFNPTYLPSLLIRTMVCFALAGLYVLLAAMWEQPGEHRNMLVRYASKWLMPACIGLPVFGAWFLAAVPPLAREISQGGAAVVTMFLAIAVAISAVLFIFAYFTAYRSPQTVTLPLAAVFLLLGLGATASTEWVREAIRKPYIIYDTMYSNAVFTDKAAAIPTIPDRQVITEHSVARLQQTGVLKAAKWAAVRDVTDENKLAAGREVFRLQCAHCHTINGYLAVRPLIGEWTEPFINWQLRHLNQLKSYMPPFAGNDAEREALAHWLSTLNSSPAVAAGGER